MTHLIRSLPQPGDPQYAHIRVQDHAREDQEALGLPQLDSLAVGTHSFAILSDHGLMGLAPMVRLELWGGIPPAPEAGEESAGEAVLPVRASGDFPEGAVVLHSLGGGPYGAAFPLAGPGTYRARVLRRRGSSFRVQLWRSRASSQEPSGTAPMAFPVRHVLTAVRVAGHRLDVCDGARPGLGRPGPPQPGRPGTADGAFSVWSAESEHTTLARLQLLSGEPSATQPPLQTGGECTITVVEGASGQASVVVVGSDGLRSDALVLGEPGAYQVRVERDTVMDYRPAGYGDDGREIVHIAIWPKRHS
ncbi:hypothetical protein AB0C86_40935 [Streptomyces lavendulae]|uniref:hypothetical protein n=1 Tax=Streptomyces lavendulae TaxID=1914 RepID=UPI0034056D31